MDTSKVLPASLGSDLIPTLTGSSQYGRDELKISPPATVAPRSASFAPMFRVLSTFLEGPFHQSNFGVTCAYTFKASLREGMRLCMRKGGLSPAPQPPTPRPYGPS